MKKCLFLVLMTYWTIFSSCDRENLLLFKDKPEVYFNKFFTNEVYPGNAEADSTVVSFFFYPTGTKDIEAKLVVNLSGSVLKSDLHFGLKVITEETTATPDEYTIDDYYVFHAGKVGEDATDILDTIAVRLHWSPRLDNMSNGVRLVVELVPNDEVGIGQIERSRAKIIMTTLEGKPEWWTNEVTVSLLGVYSQKKYKLFLNNVDKKAELNGDLIRNRPDLARKLVLQFKQWLSEQNPPIEEADGTLMKVTL